jgi:hypothetical protein
VVSDSGQFRSDALDTGESFSLLFDKPGAYHYACSIHPRMVGTVPTMPARTARLLQTAAASARRAQLQVGPAVPANIGAGARALPTLLQIVVGPAQVPLIGV